MKTPSSPNNLIDIFVGVDIGKSFHCAAAINGRGNVLLKPVKVLASAEGFAAFEALVCANSATKPRCLSDWKPAATTG